MLYQLTLSFLLFVLSSGLSWAYDEDENWNISLQIGTHMPQISTLRNGLLKSPMIGRGTLIPENREQGQTESVSFHFPSPLSGDFNSAKSMIQFEWRNESPVSMTFGFGTWEATAYGNTSVDFPIQGKMEKSLYERSVSMSYTEYNIGAKAKFYSRGDFNFFGQFYLNEIFDIDYREDLRFSFHQGTEDAYQRIVVLEAQTASLFTGVVGITSEWVFSKTVTFGARINYLLASQKVQLRNGKLNFNIQNQDQLNLNGILYPFATPNRQTGAIEYLPEDTSTEQLDSTGIHKPMNLSFSGWQFMLSMNIYY